MTTSIDTLEQWLLGEEDEHLEFKEARTQFSRDRLREYCVALGNEGGGKLILGVSKTRPRKVVGTQALQNVQATKHELYQAFHMRVEIEEIPHPHGRVIVVTVDPRPRGKALDYKGRYLMRSGESLVGMTFEMLRAIAEEVEPDFSARVCRGATLGDLSAECIERFRDMWRRKSGNQALTSLSHGELLRDAELLVDGGVTYAALILLATRKGLGKYLPDAEVIFEYRTSEASVPYAQRLESREGFFAFHDDLWNTINLRNDVQTFQDGLFMRQIPTFGEGAVREGILNAVSHRDYRARGSVFIRQFPRRLEITSPGGFPEGVTAENILWKQVPRNRRIAEAFEKCGLVDRSGQGTRRMFVECIEGGKLTPDYNGTDDYQVVLTLHGEINDPRFLGFLEKIAREKGAFFGTRELLAIDAVHRGLPIPDGLRDARDALIEQGVIERVSRGRGTKYILSRRFYGFLERNGQYTRKRGLDRSANKQLLLEHILRKPGEGAPAGELQEVLPNLSRYEVYELLRELRDEGKIRCMGKTKAARWFPNTDHTNGSSSAHS